ncbi:MAG: ABC transporter ATP-binding protein [Planctomycetota bacterium]
MTNAAEEFAQPQAVPVPVPAKTPARKPHLTPFRRLMALVRPELPDILAVIAFGITIGILLLATPIAVQALVNSVALGGLMQPLFVIAALLLLALTVAAAFVGVQTWTVELLQRRLFVRMVADLSARLPRVKLEAYDDGHGPELVNRFFDVITIQKAAPELLIRALGTALSIFVGLSVLAFYHPLLFAFDVILVAVIVIIVLGPIRRGERTAINESSAKYAMVAWMEEIARSPFTFRSGGARNWIEERSGALARDWVDARRAHFRVLFSQVLGALTLQVIASVALLGIGGLLVIQGSLTLGQLVAAEIIVTAVVASVAKMGKHLETWYDVMAAVSKVGALLDVPIDTAQGEECAPRPPKGSSLELADISWRGTRDHALFAGVDLQVAPGERIGVTGPTGSGKSALVELLWRMRAPASGAIRLDGRDLRDLSGDEMRSEIAAVAPVEVVHGTVRENVNLRRESVTGDDVRRAIANVGLDDTVNELPDGLETVLHPHARTLSEGELRQLMLARAIASGPGLLAVDAHFDRSAADDRDRIFDILFDDARPWTLVVVSNLPEVLERCDRVLKLHPNRPAEVVTFNRTNSED